MQPTKVANSSPQVTSSSSTPPRCSARWFTSRGSCKVTLVPNDPVQTKSVLGQCMHLVTCGPCQAFEPLDERSELRMGINKVFGPKGTERAALLEAAAKALTGSRKDGTEPAVPAMTLENACAKDSPYHKLLLGMGMGVTVDDLEQLHGKDGKLLSIKSKPVRARLCNAFVVLILSTRAFSAQGAGKGADYRLYQAMVGTAQGELVKKAFADTDMVMVLLKALSGNVNFNALLANTMAENIRGRVESLFEAVDAVNQEGEDSKAAHSELGAQQQFNRDVRALLQFYGKTVNHACREQLATLLCHDGEDEDAAYEQVDTLLPKLEDQPIGKYLQQQGLDWSGIGAALVALAVHDPAYDPDAPEQVKAATAAHRVISRLAECLPELVDLYTVDQVDDDSSDFITPARSYFRSAMHTYSQLTNDSQPTTDKDRQERASVARCRAVIWSNLVRSAVQTKCFDVQELACSYHNVLHRAVDMLEKYKDVELYVGVARNDKGGEKLLIEQHQSDLDVIRKLAQTIDSIVEIRGIHRALLFQARFGQVKEHKNLCAELAVLLMSMVDTETGRKLQEDIVAQEEAVRLLSPELRDDLERVEYEILALIDDMVAARKTKQNPPARVKELPGSTPQLTSTDSGSETERTADQPGEDFIAEQGNHMDVSESNNSRQREAMAVKVSVKTDTLKTDEMQRLLSEAFKAHKEEVTTCLRQLIKQDSVQLQKKLNEGLARVHKEQKSVMSQLQSVHSQLTKSNVLWRSRVDTTVDESAQKQSSSTSTTRKRSPQGSQGDEDDRTVSGKRKKPSKADKPGKMAKQTGKPRENKQHALPTDDKGTSELERLYDSQTPEDIPWLEERVMTRSVHRRGS